jgi:hypothetical protein
MNNRSIVIVYVIVDFLLKAMPHTRDKRAGRSDARILTRAIVAAQALQNHRERTNW